MPRPRRASASGLIGRAELASDLDKARKITNKREVWVDARGALRENIAVAVAEGIALGRKEGLELAAKLIGDHISAHSR